MKNKDRFCFFAKLAAFFPKIVLKKDDIIWQACERLLLKLSLTYYNVENVLSSFVCKKGYCIKRFYVRLNSLYVIKFVRHAYFIHNNRSKR